MASTYPIVIGSKPGIKRDGTVFEGDYYVDAKWCRWQRGLPRKMGGYRQISGLLNGIPRELEIYSQSGLSYVVSGHPTGVDQFTVDMAFNTSAISSRTPGGFVGGDAYDWQFCEVYDTASNTMKLLAVAVPILTDIDSATTSTIYIGDAYGVAALAAVATPPPDLPSGGIMALQSYAVAYGSNGLVEWCVSNKPSDWTGAGSGESRVTDQKIVKGLPLRGQTAAAALLWSLNALIRMSFSGSSTVWDFTTLSSESSILSPNTVIEYDGIYYWAGVDRFLSYNGIIQEVPNDLNLNFFFDNINYAYRGKAFAFKVPRYGEIWFCAPLFNATEPNYAVIYNVAESRRAGYPVWYDTILPTDFRSSAHYAQVLRLPIMGSPTVSGGKYSLWAHEIGTDQIVGSNTYAIESYFETGDISTLTGDKPQDSSIHVECIEPDFLQVGDMTVQVRGRVNARSQVIDGPIFTFPDTAVTPDEQLVYLRDQRRQMRFKFGSNVAGGNYQMGQTIAHIGTGDSRRLG
jgi:hypothetical protein